VVADARRLDDNIGQRVAVARRGDQQVQDVVAARGRGDVLRQVVPLRQVVEARVQLTAAGSWAVEVAAYDKPLLGC